MPSSSGKASSIVKDATPFRYFKSTTSEDTTRRPSFFHSILGSGSPDTETVSCSLSPSLMRASASLRIKLGAVNTSNGLREFWEKGKVFGRNRGQRNKEGEGGERERF